MLTDSAPKKARLSQFVQSEGIKTLDLPEQGHLTIIAKSIESAMKTGTAADVGHACAEFLDTASKF